MKRSNICIISILKREKIKNKHIENLFNEIIADNFLNVRENVDIQIQGAFRTPKRHDQKRKS
jgi:hypothetical protein